MLSPASTIMTTLSLVGKPYEFPSYPPNSFDCWSLVKYVRGLYHLKSPLPFDDAAGWCKPETMKAAVEIARVSWTTAPRPVDLCMAVMETQHVGVVLDGGVLHALARHCSVVWTPVATVRRRWPNVEWWVA